MRVLIIRHGDPDYAHDSLTEKGFREAALLRETLKNEGITSIYVSPLGRAQRTAEPTAEFYGIKPTVLEWLREFPARIDPPYEALGVKTDWPIGCPWNMMPRYWTAQEDFFKVDKWSGHPLYEGTTVEEVVKKIDKGWDELLRSHGYARNGQIYSIAPGTDESQTIALFCHLGLGLALLSRILNAPLPMIWQSFFLPTTSVTTLLTEKYAPCGEEAVMRVIGLGDVSHLRMGGEPVSSSGLHCEILDSKMKTK